MPELPEMENYRRLLIPLICQKQISDVEITRTKSINVDPEVFREQLVGTYIVSIERRAKHLLFHLSTDHVLVLHLMLGGWIFFGNEEQKPDRTTQVVIHFGTMKLYFIGLRLGYLHLFTRSQVPKLLAKLGPEPSEPSLTPTDFQRLIKSRKSNLKVTLVDQSFLSGIGNCYSDEICFYAGILPARKANALSLEEERRLYEAIHSVLNEATRYGGYMESPLFVGDQLTGQFDSMCRVYDREGEPCFRCGSKIIKDEISSKKCFYCSNCQS
ncbi:Fpg/Nei family DNA glycosylase [Paenibacillus eucommiae]|uniref:Formamidopyrimidine-DNA glycosylase n=1 Tax=Paenibacillus eucommiae TaxID=1355755 RepID=A0ABS4J7L0_9BACL|nr:Fpg/Nei family DNA glycosylase [Paenibacillus eucommiae]MBP1995230.1 formamidopyrimidine-DNA glycosylase [Paenibacillus eucommiae]